MSLANDQITAQNFKDFYNGIRPYLNGQVPTFANAFNKSDLYSTDEKIVGCWIDGKPLYQKTIIMSSVGNPSYSTSGINIVDVKGILWARPTNPLKSQLNSRETEYGGYWREENNYLTLYNTSNKDWHNSDSKWYVTLQYTKTTDTAIKVGDGNDYSTDEQIVGTWLDGKPLYQKTYITTGDISIGYNAYSRIFTPPADLEKVIKIEVNPVGVSSQGALLGWNAVYFTSYFNPSDCGQMASSSTDANIRLIPKGTAFTIQYTKTTDPSGDVHIYQGRINDILSAADDSKVTASSSDSSAVPAWKAFDGKKGISSGTYASPYYSWLAGNSQAPAWLMYHFTEQKWIRQVDVYLYCNHGTYTGAIKIQASNDGTNWTDISVAKSVSVAVGNEIKYSLSCDETAVWSYVRLYSATALAVHYGASVFVGEMEIYGGIMV